jgi:hypothetical protein
MSAYRVRFSWRPRLCRLLALPPLAAFVLVAVIAGAQSLNRPSVASGQGYCGGSYPPVGAGCPPTGYQYCADNGIAIIPNGQSCMTSVSYSCGGVPYAAPITCNSTSSGCGIPAPVSAPQPCVAATTAGTAYPGSAYPAAWPPMIGSGYPGAALSPFSGATNASGYSGAGYPTAAAVVSPYAGVASPSAPAASLSAASPNALYPAAASSQGFLVNYVAGWNLVAGPSGTILGGTAGPLYTLGPGDATYRVLPPGSALTSGAGAWAYFSANTSTGIQLANSASLTIPLPAGQFVLIGNPGDTTATVSGADAVLVYDASTASYQQSTYLVAGEGAWAISLRGGQATLTNGPAARGEQPRNTTLQPAPDLTAR